MSSQNPFDQLGLKKELVKQLARTNQLDAFLHDYLRITQHRIHTDKGGDHDLSAIVNSAYSEVRRHPENVSSWIDNMQNGAGEYLAVIEGLVAKVEQLEKVEQEYEDLRLKYAELVASGHSAQGHVRTTSPRVAPDVHVLPRAGPVRTPPRADPAPPSTPPVTTVTASLYTPLKSATYALGIEELRSRAKEPFFFAENLRARMEQADLYDTWLYSRCGIAYQKGSTKLKIMPDCAWLKNIPTDFASAYITGFGYRKITDGIELDSSKGVWNQLLTKKQVMEHPGWRALVGDDTALLKAYVDSTWDAYATTYGKGKSPKTLMGFWIIDSPEQEQLRAVFVGSLDGNSDANGRNYLGCSGRFLLR